MKGCEECMQKQQTKKEQPKNESFFDRKAVSYIQRNWWDLVLRGLLFLVFGFVTVVWPALTAEIMIVLIGIMALGIGAFKLLLFFKKDVDQSKIMILIEALAGFFFGVMAFTNPAFIGIIAIFLIGFSMLYYGILDVIMGFVLPSKSTDSYYKWLIVLNGIVSIIFGIVFLTRPRIGFLSIMWIISFYAILGGCVLISAGITKKMRTKTILAK